MLWRLVLKLLKLLCTVVLVLDVGWQNLKVVLINENFGELETATYCSFVFTLLLNQAINSLIWNIAYHVYRDLYNKTSTKECTGNNRNESASVNMDNNLWLTVNFPVQSWND